MPQAESLRSLSPSLTPRLKIVTAFYGPKLFHSFYRAVKLWGKMEQREKEKGGSKIPPPA